MLERSGKEYSAVAMEANIGRPSIMAYRHSAMCAPLPRTLNNTVSYLLAPTMAVSAAKMAA
jgi:hypothetical protein